MLQVRHWNPLIGETVDLAQHFQDNGYYTCNVVTPLQTVNSTIQLIVSGESPKIINNLDKVTIHEGETLGELKYSC